MRTRFLALAWHRSNSLFFNGGQLRKARRPIRTLTGFTD